MKKFLKKLLFPITHWWRMRKMRKAIEKGEDPFIYD